MNTNVLTCYMAGTKSGLILSQHDNYSNPQHIASCVCWMVSFFSGFANLIKTPTSLTILLYFHSTGIVLGPKLEQHTQNT